MTQEFLNGIASRQGIPIVGGEPAWMPWTTPEAEIAVLRDAIHRMARWYAEGKEPPAHLCATEQNRVDFFIAAARTQDPDV